MLMPYLDYNATTPVDKPVLDIMLPWLEHEFANPSSDYPIGKAAAKALTDARGQLNAAVGGLHGSITFTGCGTEANNLALLGTFLPRLRGLSTIKRFFGCPGHLIVSAIEHPATMQTALFLKRLGFRLTILNVDATGFVTPQSVEKALRRDTLLVSIMHANNEIGSIQPIEAIAKILNPRGILFHTDAAQTLGKIPVNVKELGVDLLSLTGHKFYAPKGVGALWVRQGVPLKPILFGGGQEKGLRSGTENVAFALGMAHAAETAVQQLDTVAPRLKSLRERLWQGISSSLGERLKRTSDPDRTLPNTLHFCVRHLRGGEILAAAGDLQASTGSACHAGVDRPSAVLCALRYPWEWSLGSIRLSVGKATTETDVDRAISLFVKAVQSLPDNRKGR